MVQKEMLITFLKRYNMPAMVRPSGKGTKVAFSILGKPANIQKQPKKKKRVNKILLFQETTRVR